MSPERYALIACRGGPVRGESVAPSGFRWQERRYDTMSRTHRTALTRADLEYELPEDRIATSPASPRDSARMLVVHRDDNRIEHRRVADIGNYLNQGDLLCMNDTAVLPARLVGERADSGGRIEGLYLNSIDGLWRVRLKSNGRLRAGIRINLSGPQGISGAMMLVERDGDGWHVEPEKGTTLEAIGHTPIPPYILKARRQQAPSDEQDRAWYRTVFQDPDHAGSVAAPTAGFHFTPELLEQLSSKGVDQTHVTLNVGAGTFAPIATDNLEDHVMHEESWSVGADALGRIEAQSSRPGRLIAVGTTSVRVLESLPEPLPREPVSGTTDLMISPPWTFRHVDGLLTNFHLPCSTLLALVAAMTGLDVLMKAYSDAVQRGYRFYSYGDAMLIL